MSAITGLSTEAVNIQNHLGSTFIGNVERTTHKIAKELLLYGWYSYKGRKCDPIAKHVGAGVYEISLKPLHRTPKQRRAAPPERTTLP